MIQTWIHATSPTTVAQFYDRQYRAHGARAFASDDWAWAQAAVATYTGPQLQMLDAGCGHGAWLAAVAWDGQRVGIDASGEAVLIAQTRDIKSSVIEHRAIEAIPDTWQGLFDIVTCWGVLEHTVDPVAAWLRLWACVRVGGILAITVPMVFPECLAPIAAEPNPLTIERFGTVDEWRALFGHNDDRIHDAVIGDATRPDWLAVYRKDALL